MFTHRRYRARRGVVLMVILGLMAMFGVVAITFVLVTGQAKRSADSDRRAGEYPEAPRAQLQQAGRIVLRGSPSHICALRHHSLLEDIYGTSGTYGDVAHQVQLVDAAGNPIPGAITAVGDFCRGQLIGFTPARAERLYLTSPSQYRYRPLGSPSDLVGRVLTMLHGVARNQSTRIVSYDPANNLLLILPFPNVTPADFIADVRNRNPILSRREYIVNGSAFTGTGFGCNTAGQNPWLLDACEPGEDTVIRNGLLDPGEDVNNNGVLDLGAPYALLPNAMGFTMDRFAELDGNPQSPDPGSYVDPAGPGGANEDYDVADYQNMLLAALVDLDGNGYLDIPSVHRPALINYHVYDLVNWLVAAPPTGPQLPPEDAWRSVMLPVEAYNKGLMVDAGGFLTPEQIRDRILARKFKSIFRPLYSLHQYFNGGNPVWEEWQQGYFYRPNPPNPPTRKNIFDSDVTAAEIQSLYWLGQQLPLLNRAPMLKGPWDVDCDGDGTVDSIWIDLGFPIHTAKDGRRYKPLFAIHCVDLDGRLNLNAHGCFAHTVMDSAGLELYGGGVNTSPLAYANAPPDPNPPPKNFPPIFLARAQGYGPPEVNLRPVLASVQEYRALLTGKDVGPPGVLHWLDGRYGEATALVTDADGNKLPDDPRAVAAGDSFVPGNLVRDNVQMLLADDPLSRNKHFQFCIRDPSTGNVFPMRSYADGVPNAFGTPPDYKGSMAIGLDLRGQPMYWPFQPYAGVAMDVNTQVPGGFDRYAWPSVNDPFEQNLSRNAARSVTTPAPIDNLFTVYELERVLRMYDRDAGRLANRLELLAPSLGGQRNLVTTESWDVPGPNLSLLPDESGPPFNHIRLRHFAQLFRQRFGRPGNTIVSNSAQWYRWSQFVAPELLAGLRMNLNRPFGNGVDDNNNGVVDEIDEVFDPASGNFEQLYLVDAAGNPITVEFDHCAGVDVDGDGEHDRMGNPARVAIDRALARQLYARYLYVLAIMVAGQDASGQSIYVPGSTNRLLGNWDHQALAQWAVNVVDFCDRDSIMTPFPYDPDPLDGVWSPSQVVWGCERPELLLGETLAWHDHRTEDLQIPDETTYKDDDGDNQPDNDADEDYDQRLRPEGALFIELYNPWSANEQLPGEFYFDRATGTWSSGVVLNQTHDGTPAGSPVWRILVALPERDAAEDDPTDPDFFEPRDPDVAGMAPATVERSIYFLDVGPEGTDPYADGAEIRYSPTDQRMAPIMPGRYGVIGPGDAPGTGVNRIGFQNADRADANPFDGNPPPRRIELQQDPNPNNPGQVSVYANDVNNPDVTSDPAINGNAQPPVAVVMDAVVTNPALAANRVPPRFSISEPRNGYPEYTPGNDEYNPPIDLPCDSGGSLWSVEVPNLSGAGPQKGTGWYGTNRRFRVVYLQRLANPLAPWHPVGNPYRTIDAMQVDLTVFNGMTPPPPNPPIAAGRDPGLAGDALYNDFYTVQRGADVHQGAGFAADQRNNIWPAERERDVEQAPQALPRAPGYPYVDPANCVYSEPFAHSFGRLNDWFGTPRDGSWGPLYVGDPFPSDSAEAATWPWLTWINRPFVNEMELLMVPGQRSLQLLHKFTVGREKPPVAPYPDPYHTQDPDPQNPGTLNEPSFRHLGWLMGTPAPFDPGGTAPVRPSRLYRLLDFVHVPSRFVGTEVQAIPSSLNDVWPPAAGLAFPQAPFPFRPPYHGISFYREPGRVNVNTISDPVGGFLIWQGLTNDFAGQTGATNRWGEFVQSRRGYLPNPGMGNLNPLFPTQFANPVRSAMGGYLVPLPQLQAGVIGEEVDSTMLRGQNLPPLPHTNPELPLFRHESSDAPEDTARNPYFRHQLMQKLAGVTTTRSNVHAVWITVGYFEVTQAPPTPTGWSPMLYQAVYPDGYQLGQELGSDTGEIKRHRAFYIFDRSIPVGFERGRDRNVDEAILLERFIE